MASDWAWYGYLDREYLNEDHDYIEFEDEENDCE